jgi:hypothetical protein
LTGFVFEAFFVAADNGEVEVAFERMPVFKRPIFSP